MTCFTHRHLLPQEFGVYSYIDAVTYKSGVFYMSESLAAEFQGVSSRTLYRIVTSLQKKGWLRLIKSAGRTKYGTFTPAQYAKVSHEEWVKIHPGHCRVNVPSEPLSPVTADETHELQETEPLTPVTAELDPLSPVSTAVANGDADRCHPCQPPLPLVTRTVDTRGNKVCKEKAEKEKARQDEQPTYPPCEKSGGGSDGRKVGSVSRGWRDGQDTGWLIPTLSAVYIDARSKFMNERGVDEADWNVEEYPPPTLFLKGQEELTNAVRSRRDYGNEVETIKQGFARFLRERYFRSYAEHEDNPTFTVMRQPLTHFAREFELYAPQAGQTMEACHV